MNTLLFVDYLPDFVSLLLLCNVNSSHNREGKEKVCIVNTKKLNTRISHRLDAVDNPINNIKRNKKKIAEQSPTKKAEIFDQKKILSTSKSEKQLKK